MNVKQKAEGRKQKAQKRELAHLEKPSAFCLASYNVLPRRLGRTEALPFAFCATASFTLAFKLSVKFTLGFFAEPMT
ncbi:hypothetical protein DC3_33700 [Deinococcus cellulosilyticus NBRC 106333 = KACC 11606]|uniref:Uncharacterized protein n=1 Tax=Deinococcus cellulosilyticus (strain DSM 18568 / NBRC 106333 / KACC 11606 / 5516J-15) TaxID=1223518 RepID=A0A511N4H2_DEIC1|nr:hypothetical protein DC3_33700 [Deinococcus cellulosilyticus NBRC 106333 = KACC 11606]